MKKSKPIEPGQWVFWFSGLWKVLTIGEENVPQEYTRGILAIRPHGFQVATLEPINVRDYVQRWYEDDVKYHGGVRVYCLKRINPVSALKRGFLDRP